ncbi:MAG: hypothetical protein K8S20_09180 [Chloroflexi bacterium]|nr:hypothetical protein [Chloroflexota bacterium]
MDEQETKDFIIHALVRHQSRSQIIQAVCEKTGMNWKEAEKFIFLVRQQNLKTISTRQSPLILFTGLAIILLGLIILASTILKTLGGTIITLRVFPVPGLGNVFYIILGAGIIIGGLRGIWDSLRQLWNS